MTERQPEGPDAERAARLDRLAAAMAVYLAHRATPDSQPSELLDRNADLRDLLEPMLAPGEAAPPGVGGPALDGPQEGTVLGDYRILREVGRGGMGTVYLAEQISLRRRVAFKLLHEHLAVTPSAIARFRREAAAASGLQHPGIVPIHEIGEWRGRHYFTMEFLEGRPLNELMHEPDLGLGTGRGRAAEIAQLVAEVADALQHAHEHGLVHRDIKPHNIMVTPTGGIRLLDFGLVHDRAASDVSVSGEFLGTPHYCSPEQAAGQPADARSDVFALGIVLYELLAGKRPFAGETTRAVLESIEAGTVEPLATAAPGAPRDLQIICGKAMAHAPNDRYRTARALADDLRRHLRIEPIHASPPGAVVRAGKWLRRHRIRVALWIAAAVVLLGTPAGYVLHDYDKRRHIETERRQLVAAERIAFRSIERTLQMLVDTVPQRVGSVAQQSAHVDAVVELCQDFLESRAHDPRRRVRVANALRVLSDVYLELGAFDSARATCRRGLAVLQEQDADRTDHRPAALARARLLRQNLRIVQFTAPANADAAFDQANAAWQPLLADRTLPRQVVVDFAATLVLRGRALADQDERRAEALPLLQDALRRLTPPIRSGSPRAEQIAILAATGRARVRMGLGDAKGALADLEPLPRRIADAPANHTLAIESAFVGILIANARQLLGDHDRALADYRRALADVDTAIARYPGSRHLRLARGRGVLRLAKLQLSTGDVRAAERLLRDHRATRIEVAEATFAERELDAQNAMLLGNCILVQTHGDSPAEVIALLDGACATLHEIAAAEPRRITLRLNLGGVYNNLAALANEHADHAAARRYAERAIAAQEAVLALAPGNSRAALFLGMHQSQLATALAAQGEIEGAIAAARATAAHAAANAGALRIAATAAAVAADQSRDPAHAEVAISLLEQLARLDPEETRRCLPDRRFATLRTRADFAALQRQVTR